MFASLMHMTQASEGSDATLQVPDSRPDTLPPLRGDQIWGACQSLDCFRLRQALAGANPQDVDSGNGRALLFCASVGREDLVQCLLDAGATRNMEAAEIAARDAGHDAVADLIEESNEELPSAPPTQSAFPSCDEIGPVPIEFDQ